MTRETGVRVVLAGGGSGGHITPALAIYEGLREALGDALDALYVGTARGLEAELVPRAGVPFATIHAAALLKPGWASKVRGGLMSARGVAEAYRLLRRVKPDVVVGTGGYVSGPVGLAAVLQHVPLVLQEQNVWPGFTNRALARRARCICLPYAEAVRHLPDGSRALVTGNPVRPSLLAMSREEARAHWGLGPDDLLVVASGGSQGAPALNGFMIRMWPEFERRPRVHLLWATGPRRFEAAMRALPAGAVDHERLKVLPYLYEMDRALRAADVAVGRAGANTCNEVLAAGVAAVLVPSPFVAENHQQKNAEHLARTGAAVMVEEARLDEDGPGALTDLLDDAGKRQAMAAAARRAFKPDALARIVGAVLAAAGRNGRI